MNPSLFEAAKKVKAIADVGLLYSNNPYDQERYREIQHLSFELLHQLSGHSFEALRVSFPTVTDYPTAKVDIRGMLLSPDKKLLLVREQADGKWSLPGGWADVGYSPKEVIVKEFKEETGLEVKAERLLAIFDKRLHAHPPQPFYVYKIVFLCTALSFHLTKGFDVLDVGYFDLAALPDLSKDRILQSQIEIACNIAAAPHAAVYVD